MPTVQMTNWCKSRRSAYIPTTFYRFVQPKHSLAESLLPQDNDLGTARLHQQTTSQKPPNVCRDAAREQGRRPRGNHGCSFYWRHPRLLERTACRHIHGDDWTARSTAPTPGDERVCRRWRWAARTRSPWEVSPSSTVLIWALICF